MLYWTVGLLVLAVCARIFVVSYKCVCNHCMRIFTQHSGSFISGNYKAAHPHFGPWVHVFTAEFTHWSRSLLRSGRLLHPCMGNTRCIPYRPLGSSWGPIIHNSVNFLWLIKEQNNPAWRKIIYSSDSCRHILLLKTAEICGICRWFLWAIGFWTFCGPQYITTGVKYGRPWTCSAEAYVINGSINPRLAGHLPSSTIYL